ncbi:hypothetical protein FACS18949_15300 [Clostridia bacterium]|nr:hypothetical protein FACS18949_15300 [Clostridia bacterium]
MSPSCKDLFQFVMEGKIRHGKHPVLDWNMGNTIIDQDAAGNIKPNKKKSTDAAVRAFQKSKGLAVDGHVGPLTWGALNNGVIK